MADPNNPRPYGRAPEGAPAGEPGRVRGEGRPPARILGGESPAGGGAWAGMPPPAGGPYAGPPPPAGSPYTGPPAGYGAPYGAAPPPPAPAPRSTGRACIWLLALAAIVVLACGLLGFGALRNGIGGLAGWVPSFPSLPLRTPTTIIQAQGPSVIEQIQALSKLETARYTIEKVLTGESTGALPPFTSDKILFVAHGDVTAGIDLSQVTAQDVEVVSGTITLRLPAPEVLNASLDSQKSYVYDRQTGIFTKADPQLESEVRQQAEQAILQAALEDGILTQAQQNAEQTLRTLLHGLHYDTVTFVTAPVPTPPSVSPIPDAVPTPSAVPTPGG